MLTKSEFLLYLDCPLHLWAKKHDQWQDKSDTFAQTLASEGYQVEELAGQFLQDFVIKNQEKIIAQKTFRDGEFIARTDYLIYQPKTDSYDLYEVKSSTHNQDKKIDKSYLYDITYQRLILQKNIKLNHCYLLLLNSEYVRDEKLALDQLFVPVLVDKEITKLQDEVKTKRQQALIDMDKNSSLSFEPCFKPKTCGCLSLCHPDLPKYHIYQLFYEGKKSRELREMEIDSLLDVPLDFAVTQREEKFLTVYRQVKQKIDQAAVKAELDKLVFPLYFLDYETNANAIPPFTGYKPHQCQAVQYSLHIVSENGEIAHREFIYQGKGDPSRETLEHLLPNLGEVGSILVWNEGFEKGVNENLAITYPDLAQQLQAVNARIVDLANVFKKQQFLHRDFCCSWSIKKVLPVICPELSYDELEIGKGDVAMMEWQRMNSDETTDQEKSVIRRNLLKYCQLDTWAMVRIWEELGKSGNRLFVK